VLLVSGSTRARSTNTAALRTTAALDVPGVVARLWDGLVDLPAFVPEDSAEPPAAVGAFLERIAAADVVVFCTPEYAGTLPGSFKNALDWTVGGGELYGKPVAWVTVAAPGRGTGAEQTLRLVLGYVGAEVIEPACVRIPVHRDQVGTDGLVADPDLRAALSAQLNEVVSAFHGHSHEKRSRAPQAPA
jgi:NAD(P)H-dependent FMN reductase